MGSHVFIFKKCKSIAYPNKKETEMNKRYGYGIATIVILTFFVAFMNGCGSSSNTDGNSDGITPVETNTVTISGFAFVPISIKISPGTTVTWTNQDSAAHTVVSDKNVFKSGSLSKGQSFQFKFDTA
jgi:plastocyanin